MTPGLSFLPWPWTSPLPCVPGRPGPSSGQTDGGGFSDVNNVNDEGVADDYFAVQVSWRELVAALVRMMEEV